MTCLLVVSPQASWNQALDLELNSIEINTVGAQTGDEAIVALANKKDKFNGVLIGALPILGKSEKDTAFEVADFIAAVHKSDEHIPILLWVPYPSEPLSRIASRYKTIAIISQVSADRISEALRSLRARTPRRAKYTLPPTISPSGTVELEIDARSVRVVVAATGKGVIKELVRDWTGRSKLGKLNDKFVKWELRRRADSARPRYVDDWDQTFKETGEDLSDELAYSADELRTGLGECLKYVGRQDNIYVRFTLLTGTPDENHPFVYVPFELLYDTPKTDFLRFLSPVARRICLHKESLTATPLTSAKSFSGPVLFVKSDAHGVQELPGVTFSGGSTKLVLPKLAALDAEFQGAQSMRKKAKLPPPDLLALEAGPMDALEQLREKMLAQSPPTPWQILHFAGHSVRADDGSVFLILPGLGPGQLAPLEIRTFARWARESEIRLVLLSSCQSSSPDAIFRLAQAGIPAVIGFRWEVEDREASFFTQCLHRELAQQVAIARAFHHAVSETRTKYPKSPTFASPMLLAQNEDWTV
ncbi:CHAT domain-containing protein [Ensifer sp. MPMI2T]|nr:CHAT domain-containing protein [Ensifer sp. MPMI2T]